MSHNTSFPLEWPEGRRRTPSHLRAWGSFDHKRSRSSAMTDLLEEIRKLGGSKIVLSSNLKIRNDGIPYSQQPRLDDPGIAIYFDWKKRSMCFACDNYNTDAKNIWAIKLTIEALRGIERWGSSDMMEQAFTGFQALPSPTSRKWWEVLGVSESSSLEDCESAFRNLVKKHHPDTGGDDATFREIAGAITTARGWKS